MDQVKTMTTTDIYLRGRVVLDTLVSKTRSINTPNYFRCIDYFSTDYDDRYGVYNDQYRPTGYGSSYGYPYEPPTGYIEPHYTHEHDGQEEGFHKVKNHDHQSFDEVETWNLNLDFCPEEDLDSSGWTGNSRRCCYHILEPSAPPTWSGQRKEKERIAFWSVSD